MAEDRQTEPEEPIRYGDALLQCLEIISGLLNYRVSAESFKAGLPIGPSGFAPTLLLRAAERFQFISKIAIRNLQDITPLILPCILMLKGGRACVLVALDNDYATIYFPEDKKSPKTVPLSKLNEIYTGRMILVAHKPSPTAHLTSTPLKWFWDTLKVFSSIYTQVVLSSALINIFLLAGTLYAMNIYDRVLPNKAFDTLLVLSVGIFLIYLFDFLLRMLRGYFIDIAGKNADVLLGSFLYERILGLQYIHRPASSGGLAHYLREFEGVREFFSSTTIVSLVDIPFAILFLVAIGMISVSMVIVPIIAIILIIGLSFAMQPNMKGSVKNLLTQMEYKHGILMESLTGLETVKSMNAEGRMLHKWEQSVSSTALAANKVYYMTLLTSNAIFFIQNAAYVFLIVIGVYEVAAGTLSVGGLIAATILTTRAIASMGSVVALTARFNQAYTALKLLDVIVNLPAERSAHTRYVHRDKLLGDIEFIDVDFSYPAQKLKALKNMSFKIKAGEKVALIGRMGSGKTTIEKLILGLYQPTSGTILIDGIDVRQLDPVEVRANIGYVSQEVYLFRGTVRDNISIASAVSDDEQILQAAKIAGVDDFVRHHPMGYDMPIGEGGSGLSGGQRQSIAVARALIHNPTVLLLDEPSASMDPESEFNLIKRLEAMIPDKTLIVVTHRNSVLALVDRIMIIDQGRVVADGPRDKILEMLTKGSIQSKGEEANVTSS
ncbi:MAG: type I secretion system permease/ATPase [Alphaproteobacteria bacterium]|jgi:ATP-binding cassette subfamily C protein LapB|nr:type I secretion system permease/ATPase [Alphaproteobacteria bacterium]